MSARECGSCTACCEGWLQSDVVQMKLGKPCQHCTAQGCAIYPTRPVDPCVKFVCGWLQADSPLPDHMRPDKSGVIVLLNQKWHRWKVIIAVPTGQTIPAVAMEWLKDYAQETRTPLMFNENLKNDIGFRGQKTTGFGPPAFVQDVRRAIGPDDIVKI